MVVLVSQAQFYIEKTQVIYFGLEGRMVFFHLWTHWDTSATGVRIPREVVLQGFFYAKDIDDAAYAIGRCADQPLFSAALATNAYYARPKEFIVVDLDRSRRRRQVRGNAIAIARGAAHDCRRFDYDASKATAAAICMDPHHAITTYAAQNYTQALAALRNGSTIMCVAHCFIAVEALKPVVLERYIRGTGKALEHIRNDWNLKRTSNVEPAPRLMLIFQGDEKTYEDAKVASDGFEHGSKIYRETVPLADECYELTLHYVRDALLSFGEIDDDSLVAIQRCNIPLTGREPSSTISSFTEAPGDFISGRHPAVAALYETSFMSTYGEECMALRFRVAWSEDDPTGNRRDPRKG